jgi:hypothetical protein
LEHKQKLEAGDPEALKKELASQKEIAEYYKAELKAMECQKTELEHRLNIIYSYVMDENHIDALIEKKRVERQQIEEIKDQIDKSSPGLPEAIWDQWIRFAELDKNPVRFWQNILENGNKNKESISSS